MIKKVFMMIVAAALMALPAVAQTFGTQQSEQPSTVFKSTSTMTGSGSAYSANPTLNENGTATYNGASASSGPRKAKQEGYGGNPWGDQQIVDHNQEDVNKDPLGDAVLPLMLCAFAFCAVTYLRRKKALKS